MIIHYTLLFYLSWFRTRSVRGYSIHPPSLGAPARLCFFRGLGCVLPPPVFLLAYLVWLGSLVPGLYEVIQYTPSLSPLRVRWAVRQEASGRVSFAF